MPALFLFFIRNKVMLKASASTAALAFAFAFAAAAPLPAFAATDREIAQLRAQLRDEIRQIKQDYETRIQSLERRLQAAEAQSATIQAQAATPSVIPSSVATASAAPASAAATMSVAAVPAAAEPAGSANMPAASANAFNPAISAILGGTYANLSKDPAQYRIQGFIPGGDEIGPGQRSFSLGESEITLSANIDHRFGGQLTFALANDNSVGVEEAFIQTKGLANGLNLKAGRMLSAIGYQNGIHAHAWDFVDAPFAYQAFFGGQYKTDGVQLKWLAPTERFIELGLEAGNGGSFPGNDRNKNGFGAAALFAHIGDDIGESASWRAGLSYLHTGSSNRSYDDVDSTGTGVTNAFSGNAKLMIADAVYKWAPNGNATQTNLKLQAEYFRRKESGTLAFDTAGQNLADAYSSIQSGWYVQGVYQFMPMWRVGLRYDRLDSGSPNIGLVNSGVLTAADFQRLASYNPSRTSLMFDYSPSEFSRLRLQLAQDKSRPGVTDNQLFLQYIMSLGVHGAHTF
jgi:hypothetical protein